MEGAEQTYKAGILVEDGVEMIAVAGAAEVLASLEAYQVCSIGASRQQVTTSCGLQLLPDMPFTDCHHLDVLVLPGTAVPGTSMPGTTGAWEMPSDALLRWIKAMSIKTSVILAAGNGVMLLAATGLLTGRRFACSLPENLYLQLLELAPGAKQVKQVRFVADKDLITTAAGTACLEGALQAVQFLRNKAAAQQAASAIAYPAWRPPVPGSEKTGGGARENSSWRSNK
jgi:transcriptional regulator GlxA family with amidase domain